MLIWKNNSKKGRLLANLRKQSAKDNDFDNKGDSIENAPEDKAKGGKALKRRGVGNRKTYIITELNPAGSLIFSWNADGNGQNLNKCL